MHGELIPIAMFVSAAAVLIFRPLTTRIGKVMERSQAEKQAVAEPQFQRIMKLLERIVDRIDRLEDRVDFTERMLDHQRLQAQLTDGPARSDSERPYHESRQNRDESF